MAFQRIFALLCLTLKVTLSRVKHWWFYGSLNGGFVSDQSSPGGETKEERRCHNSYFTNPELSMRSHTLRGISVGLMRFSNANSAYYPSCPNISTPSISKCKALSYCHWCEVTDHHSGDYCIFFLLFLFFFFFYIPSQLSYNISRLQLLLSQPH